MWWEGREPSSHKTKKEVKPIGETFTLFIGGADRKTFEQFLRKYPNPETSKVILGLIRKHLKGETP